MAASLAVPVKQFVQKYTDPQHAGRLVRMAAALAGLAVLAAGLVAWRTVVPVLTAPDRPGFHHTAAGITAFDENRQQMFGMAAYHGSTYYFDEAGLLQTGWIDTASGSRCYARSDGRLLSGLQTIDGATYYFAPNNFALRTGFCSVNGVYRFFDRTTGALRSDGFIVDGSDTYYAADDGTLLTGWQDIDGRRYCFNAIGHLLTGYATVDGQLYNFSEDGVLRTGFREMDGTLYWFGEDGVIRPGYQTWDGADRLFDGEGRIMDGWQTIADTQYYYDFGVKVTGEREIDGETWNFGDDGVLRTGWVDRNMDRYYYDDHGYFYTGWQQIGKNRYHFEDNGVMTVSTSLDGYYIDANGVASKKLTQARTVQECYDYVRHYLSYLRIPSDTPENMLQHALTKHYGACYHYATLFNYVLNQAGIENDIIWGHNPKGGTHVWNRLKENGLIWDSCNGFRGITEQAMADMGYTW